MRFIFALTLRLIVGSSPVTLLGGLRGPFMERLPEKFWTTPSPMHPVLVATVFGHRSDAAVLLYLGRAFVAIPLRSEGSDQARNQRRAGSR